MPYFIAHIGLLPLVPVLSQMNTVPALPTHFLKIHFNIIASYRCLSGDRFPSGFAISFYTCVHFQWATMA